MKKNKFLKVFSSAMALSIVLAGCSTSSKSSKDGKPAVEFKTSIDNGGSAVSDSVLKVGILSADPLTGMFKPVFHLQATDNAVMEDTMAHTFAFDHSYKLKEDDEDAPVKFHLDKDKKQVTLTIRKDLKWSNNQDVVADDIIATYELMANPKYKDNIRYKSEFETIEGLKDYHEGKAEKISGITKKDDKTVVIQYKDVKPALLWGSGFITTFLNKDQVAAASKDFSKFVEAELNTKPLSYGPYYLDKVVNGESVLAKQNPYYYKKDDVKVKEIQFKVVAPAQASSVIKNGEIDYMSQVTPNVWSAVKDYSNGTLLGQPDFYISYVGFKLGTWDKEKNEVKVNPNAKAADKRVRQAFGYAVDWDQLNEKIYKGLRFTPTNSGIYPTRSEDYYDKDGFKFKKDVEKAKKLLDEAGLKDVDGDGLREDKDGKKLTFNFAIRNTGQDYDQTLADAFIKSWKEVGLDVKLLDNKLMGKKEWDQRVLGDDPEIDLFLGAGHHGSDPSRQELFGRQSQFNYFRYTSNKIDEAFKEQRSDEMFDDNKLKEAYNKFDDLIADELPFFGLSWDTEITYVNKRVKHFNVEDFTKGRLSVENLELTKEVPEK